MSANPGDVPTPPSATPMPAAQQPQLPQLQALPSLRDLAKGVPASGRPEDGPQYPLSTEDVLRDSGVWSMHSRSKHSSTASFAANPLHLPALNSTRTSPGERLSAVSVERSPLSATYTHHGSPITTGDESHAHLSQLNQSFEPFANGHHRDSADLMSPPAPRPSSVSGSVNGRLNHLALASPLASTTASQTSLVSGLQRERGILKDNYSGAGYSKGPPSINDSCAGFSKGPPSINDSCAGYSTGPPSINSVTTTSLGRRRVGRTAPPIGGLVNSPPPAQQWQPNPHAHCPTKGNPWAFPDPELGPAAMALKPTKGLPWAFPDPDLARSASKSELDVQSQHQSMRRDSIGAASISSSLFTSDSRLPPGQRRFEDDLSSPTEPALSVAFSSRDASVTDLSGGVGQHHHHQLQHRQLTALSNEHTPTTGTAPYSRTPELRISHKLAERKRRCEMKTLFEELRVILPTDGRVNKSSKWEILTRAIEYIRNLEQGQTSSERRVEMYRAEAERSLVLQRENNELRDELHKLRLQASSSQSMSMPNVNLHYHPAGGPPSGPHGSSSTNARPTLPIPGPSTAMQGVQYSS